MHSFSIKVNVPSRLTVTLNVLKYRKIFFDAFLSMATELKTERKKNKKMGFFNIGHLRLNITVISFFIPNPL